MTYDQRLTGRPWPFLDGALVVVGGVPVTCSQAAGAAEVLAGSRTSAIAPVLRAAGSPLASCDYLAAAAPWLSWARGRPKTGRAGAAGRHVTKDAFCRAIAVAVDEARQAWLAGAMRCIRADARYAAQIAADAVEVKRREHAARVRRQAEGDISRAVAQCALTGQACALESACGTGACRFAPGWLAPYGLPAAPGKLRRPAGHIRAGTGFSAAPAIAAALDGLPYRPQVTVEDTDLVTCTEEAA